MVVRRFAGNLARHLQTWFATDKIVAVPRAHFQLQSWNWRDDARAVLANAASSKLAKPANCLVSTAPSAFSRQLTTTRMRHRLPYPYDLVSCPS